MRKVSASKAALPHTPLYFAVLLKEGFKAHPWTIRFCIQDELLLRDALARRGQRAIEDEFEIDFDAIRRRAARFAEIVSSARDGDDSAQRLLGEFSTLFSRIGFPSEPIRNLQRWFAKALLRDERRIIDYREMLLGHTGVHGDRIVSRSVLVSRRAQLIRQRKFVAQAEITTKTTGGETLRIPFADVCNTAEKRFAKAYVRLKGLEQHCVERKLAGFFVTLTLPAHFHPNPSSGRSSWDGTTPSEGHAELQRRWRSFQRRFGKVWGVRVEEQHKDGCVHWHALMFMPPEREDEFVAKIEKYFGAPPATDVKRHDPTVAACATYFAKYMMKTTATGHLSGEDASICERADAHRATWGGRCMQFFDVPGSGTVWDELRRVKNPTVRFAELSSEIHALHEAACSNEYARFLTIFAPMRAEKRIGIVYGQRRGSTYLRGLAIDCVLIDTHEVEWQLSAGAVPIARDAAVADRTLRHSYPSRAKDKTSAGDGGKPIQRQREASGVSTVDGARRAPSMRRGFEGMQSPRLTTFARKCSEYPSHAKGAVDDGSN